MPPQSHQQGQGQQDQGQGRQQSQQMPPGSGGAQQGSDNTRRQDANWKDGDESEDARSQR